MVRGVRDDVDRLVQIALGVVDDDGFFVVFLVEPPVLVDEVFVAHEANFSCRRTATDFGTKAETSPP